MRKIIISSFFVNVLKKQPLLVHGTSPRFYEINGGEKPFCFFGKKEKGSFFDHQTFFLHSMGLQNKFLFHVNQVHGDHIYALKNSNISVNELAKYEADGIITNLPDCPIMVLTADCVPITIYDPIKHVVGIVHAGRMGTQKHILTNTIEGLSNAYGSTPKDLVVAMGPAIRGCCYEVDESCARPFIEDRSCSSEFVKKTDKNKFFLDLPKINQTEGCKAGVLRENIFTEGPCTFCENDRWYSYRKEGRTGRLMTMAMLRQRK